MALSIHGAPHPRHVEAVQGLRWWRQAWDLFVRQGAWWVVLGLLLVVLLGLLMLVPLIGPIVSMACLPVLVGSFMLAARKVQEGGAVGAADLLLGFQQHRAALAVLGVLFALATLLITAIAGPFGTGFLPGIAAGTFHGGIEAMALEAGAGLLGLLVSLLCGTVLGMALWFAPALVVFHGTAPWAAVKASFAASLKNVMPFLLYSVVYFVVAFIASILFGLGWLVLVPVMLLTVYVSYVDVFGA